jgi:predicted glycosyltransferase
METVWFDALTPKHIRLATFIKQIAERKGYRFLLTTRHYDEITGMAKLFGLKPEYVGRHGGALLKDKLRYSAERLDALVNLVVDQEIKYVVCHASPEATRIGFGLGCETININDSPHAEAVARLTVPLTTKLISSSYIPKKAWMVYGLKRRALISYKGLEVITWIKRQKIRPVELGLRKPVVLFRPEEVKASYLNSSTNGSLISSKLREAQEKLGFSLAILPRYESQRQALEKVFPAAYVLKKQEEGLSLISSCDVFIGAGGTMTWEAALLGKPTISAFPEKLYIGSALEKLGLLTRATPSTVFSLLKKILTNYNRIEERSEKMAKRVVSKMEDPLGIVEALIS